MTPQAVAAAKQTSTTKQTSKANQHSSAAAPPPPTAASARRAAGRSRSPGCSAFGSFTWEETQVSIISAHQAPPNCWNTFTQELTLISGSVSPCNGFWQKERARGPHGLGRWMLYKPPPLKDVLEIQDSATREGKHLQFPLIIKVYLQYEAYFVSKQLQCRSPARRACVHQLGLARAGERDKGRGTRGGGTRGGGTPQGGR